MIRKELRYAAFIAVGALLLGSSTRLISSGHLLLGVLALAAIAGLAVIDRRRIKAEQGEEALRAAEEYDRLHGEESGGTHNGKKAP